MSKRTRLGDFEGDTIVGLDKKDRVATHVDRASGECNLGLVISYDAAKIATLTTQTVKRSPLATHTITYDRGNEFAEYERLADRTPRSTLPMPMLPGSVEQTKTSTGSSGSIFRSAVTLKPSTRDK